MNAGVNDRDLRGILERMSDGVVLLDRWARISYINAAAARIVGKPQAELGGVVLWDVVAEPIGPALRATFDRILGGEELVIVRNFFSEGRWYEIVAHPMGDAVLLFGRNITERLQAEALRRESEQRLRILIDGVKDYSIILLDPKGLIASWNVGAERLFGYRAREILGKDHAVLYAPEDVDRARDNLQAAVSAGRREDERSCVRRDGSRFVANGVFSPLYDDLGQPSGFAVVTRDVTEHRRMEQRLRTSEEHLRLAIAAAEVGTWEYLIRENRFVSDPRTLGVYGFPSNALEHATEAERAERIHPDDRDRVLAAFAQAVDGGSFSAEYRIIDRSTGGERWLEARGKALLDDAGRPFRVLGAVRDITERNRRDEFLRLMPGLVAHDLRSPAAVIKLAAGRLLKIGTASERVQSTARMILRAAEQMGQLTSRLLDFTQARYGGGIPLERTTIDLAEVLRDAIAAEHLVAPKCEIDFDLYGDCRGAWDRTRLSEVAGNLIGNAIKHGAGEPVHVVLRGESDQVILTVHNGGAPIPAELLPVLFDPFRRAERSESGGVGSRSYGLGLYITREIVWAHGGAVDVTSTKAAGTTFAVRLPRAVAAHAPQPSP